MDRGAWEATVHGPQRVGPKLKNKTKQKQINKQQQQTIPFTIASKRI